MLESIAYAADGRPGFHGFVDFLPIILIFIVFYVLLILPQQKKIKKHREFINNLKRGDEIVTSGGIYGKITGITDNVVTIEIADKVRIKVSKDQIMRYSTKGE
jgi:preprotein translocase subunit YajC